jgi:hypothetical protein
MRSMFSVVTPRIWVSPRSNSAEPCTRGQHLDLGGELADVLQAAAVDAGLVLDDAAAHDGLGERAERGADLALAALEAVGQRGLDLLLGGVGRLLALGLAGDLHRGGQVGLAGLGDGLQDVVLVVDEDGEVERLLGALGLSSFCARQIAAMAGLAASRPSATTSSVGRCRRRR